MAKFLERPLMFVYQIEKGQIVAFLTGYELAAGDDFDLTDQLSAQLRITHKIPKSNPGWPGQVQEYADKKGIDFFNAFKEIALPLLL
ncbi:hypothetical protein [Chitinophaga nivalis]|uniref:Uncharacterized protein n=1 Tax=Chitinophaga nivalis TaxID=2991709 RepID=A0ABT3IN04_9BACT|nr:hypothetical protein [Chitinophaga nivalis]MCW3465022.1 hypothetical protein [Chitinophaga nivalis]MCW3485286.1 hypothetical protein [Chitinophaga nivalis]